MIRRGFLKSMLAAPFAARAVNPAQVVKDSGAGIAQPASWSTQAGLIGGAQIDQLGHHKHMKKQLAALVKGRKAWMEENRSRIVFHQFDPDLQVNRSFSLAAKQRLQVERDLLRSYESEKRYLQRAIKNFVRGQG